MKFIPDILMLILRFLIDSSRWLKAQGELPAIKRTREGRDMMFGEVGFVGERTLETVGRVKASSAFKAIDVI